jgi:hypothetical protein
MFTIRLLEQPDLQPMAAAFAELGWQKRASQSEVYLSVQEAGARVVLVAFLNGEFSGYVTIVWQSHFPAFCAQHIPEIVDFNVCHAFVAWEWVPACWMKLSAVWPKSARWWGWALG